MTVKIADGILGTIGRTPVVRLNRLAPAGGADTGLKYLAGDLFAR